jgi:hypothetical protein
MDCTFSPLLFFLSDHYITFSHSMIYTRRMETNFIPHNLFATPPTPPPPTPDYITYCGPREEGIVALGPPPPNVSAEPKKAGIKVPLEERVCVFCPGFVVLSPALVVFMLIIPVA